MYSKVNSKILLFLALLSLVNIQVRSATFKHPMDQPSALVSLAQALSVSNQDCPYANEPEPPKATKPKPKADPTPKKKETPVPVEKKAK